MSSAFQPMISALSGGFHPGNNRKNNSSFRSCHFRDFKVLWERNQRYSESLKKDTVAYYKPGRLLCKQSEQVIVVP